MLAILAAALLAAPATDSVHYSLSPRMRGDALAGLTVEMRFAGDADGETRLNLPVKWAGSDSLWRNLSSVRVEGATSVRVEDGFGRVIAHRPGAPLVIHYDVSSPYAADPGFEYQKAEPVIRPDWFFIHGEGVFATLEGRLDNPASFAWARFPAGWKMASDLDHLAGTRAGTVNDVVESVAIGAPDLVVAQRTVGGAPLRVAVRGHWDFSADQFADVAAAIMDAENQVWGDAGRPFSIPVAPLGGAGSGVSSTGTGRSDAFSVASTPGFNLREASRFLAHEYMHTWIARQLGGSPEVDAHGFWFSEGFTDYMASRVLLRAGLWTPEEFARDLNLTLLRYGSSTVRGATAARIAEGFWTDQNLQQLPYDRGHLMAVAWDARLRAATSGRMGLDGVLAAQYRTAARNGEDGGRVPAPVLFPRVVRAEAGVDLSSDITRVMENGGEVALPADAFAGCARVDTASQPAFHRGFDARVTSAAGGIIAGVDSGGPSFAAGLRNGMRLIRRESGQMGDASVPLAYRVSDADGERVIRYLPAGSGRVHFQRVTLLPEAATEQCRRVMAGG